MEEFFTEGEPIQGGIRQLGRFSRQAPHALTPEEVLASRKQRENQPQAEAGSAKAGAPIRPAQIFGRAQDAAGAADSADTTPTCSSAEPRKSAYQEKYGPAPVNPFLLNRNIYDKTLHLEPVEQPASCRVFKTPSEEDPKISGDVSSFSGTPKALGTEHTTLPRIRVTPPAAEEIAMNPAPSDLNLRKRKAFEEAKQPDRSYHISEPSPPLHRSSQAEPAPPQPMDSFYITSPIDLSRELSGADDVLTRLQRDAKRAKGKIRLFDGDEEETLPDEALIFPDDDADVIDDFNQMEDAPAIRADLAGRRSKTWVKTVLTGIGFILLALAAVLPALGVPVPLISGDENVMTYLILHGGILLLGCLFNASTMRGLLSLISFKPDFDSSVALCSVAALAQTALLMFNPDQMRTGSIPSFAAAAMLGFFLSNVGKLYMLTRISENFEEVASLQRQSAAFLLEDDQLALDAAEGVALGAPYVCCTRETEHLRHFLYHSFCEDPADILCARLAPVSLLAAALAFGSALLLGQTPVVAVSALCVVLCLFLPTVCLVAGHRQMFAASRRVAEEGGMLSGFDAVSEFSYTSCLNLDARDLFSDERVVLHSIRTFGNLAIDQAIMDCTSVAIAGGSPLSDLFDKVIEGQRKILPRVKSLDYEDGCGISGIVSGRQILVGNRELCIRHGILNLPDEGFENKILRSGKFPVYLASNGELAAMFIVSYEVDPELAEELSRLTKSGVSLLISTSDPNISDQMICSSFGLPAELVRVLPADVSARLHQHIRKSRSEPALLSHKNSISALAAGIRACVRLRGNFRFLVIAQIVFVCLGAMVALYALVSHSALWMSLPFLLLFQVGTLLLSLIILAFRKP